MTFDEPKKSDIKKWVCSFISCILVFCHLHLAGYAQVAITDYPQPYNINIYNSQSGLPQNTINKITRNARNELLLLTGDGLCGFDGTNFRSIYPINDETSFIDFEEKNDTFYLCTINGYLMTGIHEKTKKYFAGDYHLSKVKVYRDLLVFGTMHGELITINRHTLSDIHVKKISDREITHLGITRGKIFAGTSRGLYETDMELAAVKTYLHREYIRSIKKHNDNIYVLTGGELFVMEDKGPVSFLKADTGPEPFVDFSILNDNLIYLISEDHVFEYATHKKTLRRFTDPNTEKVEMTQIFYSPEINKIFIGTSVNGIYKLNKNVFRNYVHTEGNKGGSINSVLELASGKVIGASYEGDIFLKKDSLEFFIRHDGYASNCMSLIHNEIWIGKWRKMIYVYRNQQLVKRLSIPSRYKREDDIYAIYRDSKNHTWVGGSQGLFFVKDSFLLPVYEQLITGKINIITELSNGFILAGGKKGLYIFNPVTRHMYWVNQQHGLLCKEVRAIYEDSYGIIWIGTTGGGLYGLFNHSVTSVNNMPGCMLYTDIFSLLIDKEGLVYMSSNNGLYTVHYEDLYGFFMGRKKTLVPARYDTKDGINTSEFNGGFQNNGLITRDHRVFFPTVRGISEFFPPENTPVTSRQHIYIESFKTSDSIYTDVDGVILLPRDNNDIEISYNSPSFQHSDNIYYQYKLSGTNNDWGPLVNEKEARFNALPAGKYNFYVRVLNAGNEPFPHVAMISFIIQPYFYETNAFKIAVMGMIVLITILIIIIQQRRMQKKADIYKQMAEFELKAVQAQMNPHFIFNCLSSIKYLISAGKNTEAEEFLDRFSFLVRKFLETSQDIYVSIQDEISMLKEYLELEKMRFQDSFTYTIDAAKDLNTQLIPTMLVQPFVENSIKHGIMHLRKPGWIRISFQREGSSLVCIIEDNGIGRIQSQVINRKKEHTSRGMGIVEEKKEIISKLYAYSVEITVTDKYDEGEKPAGTMINIKIPLR